MSETAIDEVVADLLETGAHVDPAADGWIPPEQLASITATAREAEIPVHVVLVPPEGGGIRAGDDLLVRVHDAGAPDGLYVGVNNVYEAAARESDSGYATLPDGSTLSLAVQQWGEVAGRSEITGEVETLLAWSEAPAALGDGLQRVVEGLADDSFEAEVEAARQARDDHLDARAAERAGEGTSLESWIPFADDETGVGDYLGVLLLGAALLVAVSRFRRRQPAPGPSCSRSRSWTGSGPPVTPSWYAGPGATCSRWARRSTAVEMSGSGSPAWAAALDHYEAAGRVLPGRPARRRRVDPLDAAGAVVLATRGLEALAAAERGAEPSLRAPPASSTRCTARRPSTGRWSTTGAPSRRRSARPAGATSRPGGVPTSSTSWSAAHRGTTSRPTASRGPRPGSARWSPTWSDGCTPTGPWSGGTADEPDGRAARGRRRRDRRGAARGPGAGAADVRQRTHRSRCARAARDRRGGGLPGLRRDGARRSTA